MNNRIIMADNNLEFSTAVARILRTKNFDVSIIKNGESAADQLNKSIGKGQRLPLVLLVDLSLPELSGIEFLSTLAREGNLCTVVAISSDFEYYDLKAFLRTPLVGVLKKENADRLVEKLLKLTDTNAPETLNSNKVAGIESFLEMNQARQ